eukprot:3098764-Rhodomonas_salina.4
MQGPGTDARHCSFVCVPARSRDACRPDLDWMCYVYSEHRQAFCPWYAARPTQPLVFESPNQTPSCCGASETFLVVSCNLTRTTSSLFGSDARDLGSVAVGLTLSAQGPGLGAQTPQRAPAHSAME